MMCNRLIESWSNAYNGMLTDSRGTSRWRHRYWHRANLMPRADRDRYGGSVTAIPATSLWPSTESLPPFHVSPLVSRLGWLIGPLRLHHRSHPLWGFGEEGGGAPFDPAVSNPFLHFRPPVSLLFPRTPKLREEDRERRDTAIEGGGKGGWARNRHRIRSHLYSETRNRYVKSRSNMVMIICWCFRRAIGDFPSLPRLPTLPSSFSSSSLISLTVWTKPFFPPSLHNERFSGRAGWRFFFESFVRILTAAGGSGWGYFNGWKSLNRHGGKKGNPFRFALPRFFPPLSVSLFSGFMLI